MLRAPEQTSPFRAAVLGLRDNGARRAEGLLARDARRRAMSEGPGIHGAAWRGPARRRDGDRGNCDKNDVGPARPEDHGSGHERGSMHIAGLPSRQSGSHSVEQALFNIVLLPTSVFGRPGGLPHTLAAENCVMLIVQKIGSSN
jgi:hypothetical protein